MNYAELFQWVVMAFLVFIVLPVGIFALLKVGKEVKAEKSRIPSPDFTKGTPSKYDLSIHVRDYGGGKLTYTTDETKLPKGISLEGATLIYRPESNKDEG